MGVGVGCKWPITDRQASKAAIAESGHLPLTSTASVDAKQLACCRSNASQLTKYITALEFDKVTAANFAIKGQIEHRHLQFSG